MDIASFQAEANGDINNDGVVNISDLLMALQILNKGYIPKPAEQARWDVAPLVGGVPQPDGVNTVGNYFMLQRKALIHIDF